ncbi:ATP-binding cassette domain-containing protein [Dysgonomonas sp. 25]|uniref:ATP-binding cassette domain-containing protein n=1 Tax=Dysgonomonas sp. 25 TaxID=2302933 RepID=UPI0013D3E358|nr:ATP-binding cassette domain-containing protein [Dysgonomonas sp. 25]NDV67670.1 ATP-binding cassette domain-containing protein [Dysgonomonas sp. 25]
MNRTIISIENAIPRIAALQFAQPISWSIEKDRHWAITGPNGAGKTLLIDILLGKYGLHQGEVTCNDDAGNPLPVSAVVKSVAFKDIYGIIDAQNSYYQQRWNKGDEQEVPVIKDLMRKADKDWLNTLTEWFGIADLMEKEVNLLSSGELRKILIVRSLLSQPKILILDNPYIGLDTASREVLDKLFVRLSEMEGLQIVLLLSNPGDIPEIITDVLPIKDKHIYPSVTRNDFLQDVTLQDKLFRKNTLQTSLIPNTGNDSPIAYDYAAILRNIHIRYGSRTILKELGWNIKRGEKWVLLGPNGSGKSTLLSLICGDNPQAYANDITLFDRKRGTGESIWDIKKHIGYISPEMHLYYLKNVPCIEIVGSGFFDTIGLYRKCNDEQEAIALSWMQLLGIEYLKDVSFLHISSGEQRLVLLARVLVKNPDLLILDEPLHGLDVTNKQRIKQLIEEFCGKDKSLIYVTHYESEIPNIIDNRLVLEKHT